MYLGRARPALAVAEEDARALVRELQVHQVELEMQNEELRRAQAAAEETSEKYCDLFDFAPVGYFLWDHEGRILEVSLAGAALLGRDRSTVVQKRFGQFVAVGNTALGLSWAQFWPQPGHYESILSRFPKDPTASKPLPDAGFVGAEGGNRTRTPLARPRILSPVRLPVSPPRHV